MNNIKSGILILATALSAMQVNAQRSAVEMLSVTFKPNDSGKSYIKDNRIFKEGWNKLPQVNFWKKVVTLPPDSGYLNIHSSRVIDRSISVRRWESLSTLQKDALRDSVRLKNGLGPEEKVVFTVGKSDFYDFSHALEIIAEAYPIFEEAGVPAFYAQSILLIECPGTLKRSSAGAAGHFQLMPGVARSMGLSVTKYTDERKDFTKCASAAAKFIQKVCIPGAEKLLNDRNIGYAKDELWFKMLVLHVYHAGAGNVGAALDVLPKKPARGSLDLITTLWQTKAASFGNASQNYSQIALANTILLYEMLDAKCENMKASPYVYSSLN